MWHEQELQQANNRREQQGGCKQCTSPTHILIHGYICACVDTYTKHHNIQNTAMPHGWFELAPTRRHTLIMLLYIYMVHIYISFSFQRFEFRFYVSGTHQNENKHNEHANWTVVHTPIHTNTHTTHTLKRTHHARRQFCFCDVWCVFILRLTTDLHLYGDVLVSFPTFLHKLYIIGKVLIN